MKLSKSKPHKTTSVPPASGARAEVGPAKPPRHVFFRWGAALGIPVLLLVLGEGLLRLGSYGYSTHFFHELRVGDGAILTDNRDFGRRFFPSGLVRFARPFVMPAVKPPGALRIFVLGESAAMGDPDFKFGLPRMVDVLLRERFPNRRIEVINAAMTAINSHVILPIARDCAAQGADLWIIYMGNNEMIGPFGSATVFGPKTPALPLVRTSLWLKTTRLGQLLDAGVQGIREGSQPLPEWGGMEMMAGLAVAHGAPATETVYRHFERNLADLLETGARAHIPMILCTVATNVRDCAPFASLHRPSLTVAELAAWQAAFDSGIEWQAKGNCGEAGAAFERAGRIDDEFADLAFRRGQCAQLLGQDAEAAAFFRQARDRDALQFRADTRINSMIRRASAAFAARRVNLLDAEELMGTNSPHGLVGAELFYEHVHLTPEANYLLARAAAEQAAKALSLDQTGSWISRSDCFRLLGLTDWSRYEALTIIRERIQAAPFNRQIDHSSQLERVDEQLGRYRLSKKPAQLRIEARQVSEVVNRQPKDPDLRYILASLLQAGGDVPGAEGQWRAAIELLPQAEYPRFQLAQLLDGAGDLPGASSLYSECLRLDPEQHDARYALGSLCLRAGWFPQAEHHLRLVVRQRPQSVEARLRFARALAETRHLPEAESQCREVLRMDPSNAAAREELDSLQRSRS